MLVANCTDNDLPLLRPTSFHQFLCCAAAPGSTELPAQDGFDWSVNRPMVLLLSGSGLSVYRYVWNKRLNGLSM